MQYDLVVIGNDPAGQLAALAAARLNRRVALVERRERGLVEASRRLGVIPGSLLREAVDYLSVAGCNSVSRPAPAHIGQTRLCIQQRPLLPRRLDRPPVVLAELQQRIATVAERNHAAIEARLEQRGVDLYRGRAYFANPHEIVVQSTAGDTRLAAEHVVIATGTKPPQPRTIPLDGRQVFVPDDFLSLKVLPRTLFVIGGGVIGSDYAMTFAALGARVTLIDGGDASRVVAAQGVALRLGEDVIGIERHETGRIELCLEGGERLFGDAALYTAGRLGDTHHLDLPAAGLEVDERGRLWCDSNLQTCVRHIYGVGDVVGFPKVCDAPDSQAQRVLAQAFAPAARSRISPLPSPHLAPGAATVDREHPEYRRRAAPRM
ncbi:MAG: hypothetical protein EXS05_10965 [Planctomycetaceae bacterium]|nr:hypothetical protein [Planctomycetaceae bacterium]